MAEREKEVLGSVRGKKLGGLWEMFGCGMEFFDRGWMEWA